MSITWKNKIANGQFYVYSYGNPIGEPASGTQNLHVILQTKVLQKYRYVIDFTRGLTESQLKMTPAAKQSARFGMGGMDVKGIVSGCDKSVLGLVWDKDNYWEIDELQSSPIVVVKKALDNVIETEFKTGKISIGQIWDYLQDTFGYIENNINLFVLGFMLKEYSSDPYRAVDENGYPESMTPDKLAEMLVNYVNKSKVTYILKLTPEEKAFYEGTERAWGINPNSSSNPEQTASFISAKMRELGYPVWSLEYVDNGTWDIVKKYINLVQCKDKSVHNKATEIGAIFNNKPSVIETLKELLTSENCQNGMLSYLKIYENGALMNTAKEIGAESNILVDIKNIFSVKHSALWEYATGDIEIKKLFVEYKFIKQTNILLNVSANTKDKAINSWFETLKFIGISCEALRTKKPCLDKLFGYMMKIARRDDLLADDIEGLLNELIEHNTEIREIITSSGTVFNEIYSPYLEDFELYEKESIKNQIGDIFLDSITVSNQKVKNAAERYREEQKKTQLMRQWQLLTGTKNPIEWSSQRKVPILCCVEDMRYNDAKQAFSILNSKNNSEIDIDFALDFISNNEELFVMLKNNEYVKTMFEKKMIGELIVVLTDTKKVISELEKLPIEPYDWYDNPIIKNRIQELASAEYNAGGSDKAIELIDGMTDAELKQRLKELVKKDIDLGIKIILNGGN